MDNYKLIKIYGDEDIEKIKNILKVESIKIRKNIDVKFIKVKDGGSQEIIIYSNGVINIMGNNKFESIKGMLCSGI